MLTLACLFATGAAIGAMFNVYALVLANFALLATELVIFSSLFTAHTVGFILVTLWDLQMGYVVGLWSLEFLISSKRFSVRTSRRL